MGVLGIYYIQVNFCINLIHNMLNIFFLVAIHNNSTPSPAENKIQIYILLPCFEKRNLFFSSLKHFSLSLLESTVILSIKHASKGSNDIKEKNT